MKRSNKCPRCGWGTLEFLRTHTHCWACNYFPEDVHWPIHRTFPDSSQVINSKENKMKKFIPVFLFLLLLTSPLAHASVESSLIGLKSVLLGSILPIFAVMGLGFAAFSFITGNPNAKQHLTYSVIGAVVLFGAQSIVDLIERLVR